MSSAEYTKILTEAFVDQVVHYWKQEQRKHLGLRVFIAVADLKSMKRMNEELGNTATDHVILGAAKGAASMTELYSDNIHGDEFFAFTTVKQEDETYEMTTRLRDAMFEGAVEEMYGYVVSFQSSHPEKNRFQYLNPTEEEAGKGISLRDKVEDRVRDFFDISVAFVELQEPTPELDVRAQCRIAMEAADIGMQKAKSLGHLVNAWRKWLKDSHEIRQRTDFKSTLPYLRELRNLNVIHDDASLRDLFDSLSERDELLLKVGQDVADDLPPWILNVIPQLANPAQRTLGMILDAGVLMALRVDIGLRDPTVESLPYVAWRNTQKLKLLNLGLERCKTAYIAVRATEQVDHFSFADTQPRAAVLRWSYPPTSVLLGAMATQDINSQICRPPARSEIGAVMIDNAASPVTGGRSSHVHTL